MNIRMYDKEKLFRYRRASRVNLYSIGEFEDYYYGYMVPDTGYLKYFELYLYDEGFVLQFPTMADPETVPPFKPQHKVFQVLKEATQMERYAGNLHSRRSERLHCPGEGCSSLS